MVWRSRKSLRGFESVVDFVEAEELEAFHEFLPEEAAEAEEGVDGEAGEKSGVDEVVVEEEEAFFSDVKAGAAVAFAVELGVGLEGAEGADAEEVVVGGVFEGPHA